MSEASTKEQTKGENGTLTHGSAPYGYCWQNGSLVPDTTESPIRKLMYELFLKHRRKKTVARLLNEEGYRTRNGALFSDMTVDRFLRDTSAKGIHLVKQTRKYGSIKQMIEIQIEPIVSVELWEQVNALLNSSQRLGKQAVQLFAGFIYCHCGTRMSVPSNSPKYVCSICRHKIAIADIEEIFKAQLESLNIPNLYDYWDDLTKEEKRSIVEQLINRISIGRDEINIEFALTPNSLETVATGQHDNMMANQSQEAKELKRESEIPSATTPTSSTPDLKEPLMNETQAAKFLGISRMTLLRKRNNGEINFFRVGFRVLYSKEKHLMPFLELCEKKAQKE